MWKQNSSSLGTVHSNAPSRSAINPSTETLIDYSLYVAETGDSDLDGWTVRNNTFETTAVVEADTATDSRWVGNLGDWDCVSGMTYRHNVGWSCGGTGDISVSPASSGGPPSSQSVFYADFDWVDSANDDFGLLATSPAIGAADASDSPATDRTGQPRDGAPMPGRTNSPPCRNPDVAGQILPRYSESPALQGFRSQG